MSRYLVIVWLAVLSACYAQGTKVDLQQVQQFTEGQTSYVEVIAVLGKPNAETWRPDHTHQALYSYTQSQTKWQSFVPGLAALQQGATAETTTWIFEFDAQHRLVSLQGTQGQTAAGSGFQSGGKQ